MRVLMLGWEYPPRVTGGLGVACAGLVRGLRENGVDVVLVLPGGIRRRAFRRRGPTGSLEVVPAGGRVRRRRIDPYAAAAPVRTRRDALYAGDLAAAVEGYASAAIEIARRRRFDLIHAHDWLTFPAGLAAKQATGRPLVAHVHATELDRSGHAEGAWGSPAARIERRALPIADRIVAVSGYTAGILRERYGVCADRIRVVHNGVDAPRASVDRPALRGRRRDPLVLFVGRMTRQKGPEQLVRAAALVARERPDVRFALAGAGDSLDAVRAEAATLGLARRIRFTGHLAPAALDRLYARADVVVMPSRSEPFGLVALEAAVRGKPVIVSRSSGVGEVLRHALRVDFGDLEELAAKILSVLELPRLRETVASGGREEARRLSWRAAGERCVAIYRELASGPPSGGTIAAR